MGAKQKKDSDEKLWPAFKKQSIQEAVIRILSRDGLQSLTMERIARETGIAKGTVYLHYKGKQALLDSVKDAALTPLMERLAEILGGDDSPSRRLESFALRYLSYFDERRNLFRVLLYEREVTRVQSARYQADRYRQLVAQVADVVGEGIDAGTFRYVPRVKAATVFVESNVAVMNQRLLSNDRGPVEADAELVSSIFLNGVGAEAGATPKVKGRNSKGER